MTTTTLRKYLLWFAQEHVNFRAAVSFKSNQNQYILVLNNLIIPMFIMLKILILYKQSGIFRIF